MRVRVWINGSEGPSYDFELVDAPRIGDRIAIAVGGDSLEGVVSDVSWHLQAIEKMEGDLALEGEPIGSVTAVHVVCDTPSAAFRQSRAAAEVDSQATH
jgi:hypothetical protein